MKSKLVESSKEEKFDLLSYWSIVLCDEKIF